MDIILGTFFTLLGVAIGSFLNVVILRYNTGRKVTGRSGCPHCGHQLSWFELIPIFSFLRQKGRCTSCGSKISLQYPIVEILTGIIFFLTYLTMGTGNIIALLFFFVVWALLVVILVYDLFHKIIPDPFVYTFIILSFASLFLSSGSFSTPQLWDAFAGPLLAAPFAFLWLISSGRWMGFGDVKLSLGLGWLVGLSGAISIFLLAFWIGASVSIVVMLYQKIASHSTSLVKSRGRFTMKSEIPFAPFLILGFALVFFFGIDFLSILLNF